MDFEQIASFLAVARHRSFTVAARERGLTQPGISRQVQRIERELGVTLLERHPNDLRLTAAGGRFLSYAEAWLGQHARMQSEIRADDRQLEGDLRIIASTTPAYLVPSLVARFRGRHPKVRPEIAITDSAEVVVAVKGGRWDVGFTGNWARDPALHASVVAEDEIVLAVPSTHPLAQRREVDLAALEDLPFIDREEGSGTLETLRAALVQRRLALPRRRVVMVLSSCQAVIAAVRQGLGFGFVSALALDQTSASDVVEVRISELPLRRQLYLIHGEPGALPPAAAAFVGFVEQRVIPAGDSERD